MEWNWKMKTDKIDVTPFLLFESSADSDDAIPDHHHHHHQEQEAVDDDAESCSYDHSSHVDVKSHDNHHQEHEFDDVHDHDHDDNDHGHDDDYGEEDFHDDDDDDDKNWGDSKMMSQERYHELCIDSSNLDDRQFWETCLGS